MRARVLVLCLSLICFCAQSLAQELLTITFEGPPAQPPGTSYINQRYEESGMVFTGASSGRFARVGVPTVGPSEQVPDNGTAFLDAGMGGSLAFSFSTATVFDLIAVDLAEYSTVVPDAVAVTFIGYRHDGTVVASEMTTDGNIDGIGPVADFQTFHFGPEFTNLDRVEVPTSGWSLDNLVVAAYEPTALLFGKVVPWGDNTWGETNVPPGLSNVIAIASGSVHSLALRADGTVVAWGDNRTGALDVPPGLTNVISIAAGGREPVNPTGHSLALREDGSLVGWGDRTVPMTLSGVVAIATSGDHSLVLTQGGSVAGWGQNTYGQSTGSVTGPTNGFVAFDGVRLSNVVGIATGYRHSLALKRDGTVLGWGNDYYGQATGSPSADGSMHHGLVSVSGQALSNAVAIAAGADFSLALLEDGSVKTWGASFSRVTEVPATVTNVIAIAANRSGLSSYCMALRIDGTVISWGAAEPWVPIRLTNALAIDAGWQHSLALVGNPIPTPIPARHPTFGTNGFSFSMLTQSGRVYGLEYKDSLSDPGWSALPLVAGNGGVRWFTDPTATNAQRFYRVRQW